MNLLNPLLRVASILILTALFFSQAQAQAVSPSSENSQRQAESHKEYPPDEVGLLKQKVEQLQAVVDKQQRALDEMDRRLKKLEEKSAPDKEPVAATLVKASSENPPMPAPMEKAPEATATAAQGTSEAQTPPRATAAQSNQSESRPVAGWSNTRPFLQSADGNFTMRVNAVGQFDFRGYQSGDVPPNTFLVRRVRAGVDGRIARYFDYRVNVDLADQRNTIVRDAFVTIHRIDQLQFRVGQFKEPFGQEEMQPFTGLEFIERSLVSNLSPARSPGAMVFGVFGNGEFEYYVGAFNGKGQQAVNNTDTPQGVLRLRSAPWRNGSNPLLKGLAFGGAVVRGLNDGGISVTGVTESRSFTFYTPDTVNGESLRVGSELTWQIGNAVLRAQYDQTNQQREELGANQTNLPGVVAKGFLTQFSYLLGGGRKLESGNVVPTHDLFSGDSGSQGFGAWELKGRFARLQISNGTAKSNHAETFYFGANWYLNRFVKYQLDFGVERFNDPLRSPKPGDRNFFVMQSRMQFAF